MRLLQPFGSKSHYYDRRIGRIALRVEPNVFDPHGFIVRWSYTVPEHEMFFVEHLFGAVSRETQDTNPSYALLRIYVTPVGGAPLDFVYIRHTSNILYDTKYAALSQVVVLEPGDVISCSTEYYGTDGTVRMLGTMIGFRFSP